MNSDVLVLDMNWQPQGFTSWQNAVKLWFEDRAIVVEEDEAGKVLHSPSFEMGLPRVIKVKNAWVRRRRQAVPCTRRNILIRDNATCQYCGTVIRTHNYSMDHVTPQCLGGKTEWANVVVACMPCNKEKGGRTPEEAGMELRAKPMVPKVNDPRYNFKLHVRLIRPEWRNYKDWMYWNILLDRE